MRKLFIGMGLGVAAAASLWGGYWTYAASTIEDKIELALGLDHSDPHTKVENVSVSGFPSKFDIQLTGISTTTAQGITWATPLARLVMASYDPSRIDIDLSQPHAIGGSWGEFALTTEGARIIALLNPDAQFALADLRFALESPALLKEGKAFSRAEKIIAVSTLNGAEGPNVFQVETEFTGVDLANLIEGLPDRYSRLGPVQGLVDVYFSKPWDLSVATGSAPSYTGAVLRRARATFGESTLTLSGKLALNADGKVTGQVTAVIDDWRPLLDVPLEMGRIDAETRDIIAEMLTDVEALNGTIGQLTLPLTIQEGRVTYGMLTLGVIPPLKSNE